MTRQVCVLFLGIVLLTAPAFAADVDGRWTGPLETPMGEVPVRFDFKADGDTQTGSMLGMDGNEIPIANGKIEGDQISYTVTLDFGGMSLEMIYKGASPPGRSSSIWKSSACPSTSSSRRSTKSLRARHR
jgi:hypothetical protein